MNHRNDHRIVPRALSSGLITLLLPVVAFGGASAPIAGSLETVEGVRVLRLWGATPFDRGYAHGYLLGAEIVELFESAVLDPRMLEDHRQYESAVRQGFLAKMRFGPERGEELRGMMDGIAASCEPSELRLKRLARNLDVRDLEAVNCAADWYRFMCSSFSAWGDGRGGGEMVTARNLDFFTLPGLNTKHLIIAYLDAGPNRKRWVSLAWPGLIGAYTAMNEQGVTLSLHDAQGRPASGAPAGGGFVPRALALRDALEAATAANAVEDVRRVLSLKPSICGNNVHVSGPFSNQAQPAAVFEYDGDRAVDGGVTLRLADQHARQRGDWLACTNHYVQRPRTVERVGQDSKERYDVIASALGSARERHVEIDLDVARKVMRDVSVAKTLQTVIFFPNRGELYVSLATADRPAGAVEPVRLRMDELLSRQAVR